MSTTPIRSWAFEQPIRSSFANPVGVLGRMAGLLMLWMSDPRELLDLLDVQAKDHVLEVGYGPGGLIRSLARQTAAEKVYGVDPSTEMLSLASRHNRTEITVGRADLHTGCSPRIDRRHRVRRHALTVYGSSAGNQAS